MIIFILVVTRFTRILKHSSELVLLSESTLSHYTITDVGTE